MGLDETQLLLNAGLRSHVFKSIIHQNFDSNTLANNIALLTLESQLIFSSRILPICFPNQGIVQGVTGRVVGFRSKGFASSLSEVELPIALDSDCIDSDLNVNERSFCAGRKGELENVCRSYLGQLRFFSSSQ